MKLNEHSGVRCGDIDGRQAECVEYNTFQTHAKTDETADANNGIGIYEKKTRRACEKIPIRPLSKTALLGTDYGF